MEATDQVLLNKSIRLSSFGNTSHALRLENETLFLDDGSIALPSVNKIRIAVEPIRLDMFRVGVKYILLLQSDHQSMNITFRSYFSWHRKYFDALYDDLIDAIWPMTASRMMDEFAEVLKKGQTIEVGKCVVSRLGLTFNAEFIAWEDLSYQKNYNRLTLNSKSRRNLYTNLYFNENYNVQVLMVLLDWIFVQKGLENLNPGS